MVWNRCKKIHMRSAGPKCYALMLRYCGADASGFVQYMLANRVMNSETSVSKLIHFLYLVYLEFSNYNSI